MRLGDSDLEPLGLETPISVLEGRQLFMDLVQKMSPVPKLDLTRTFNPQLLPRKYRHEIDVFAYWALEQSAERSIAGSEQFLKKLKIPPAILNTPIHQLNGFLSRSTSRFEQCLAKSRGEWKGRNIPEHLIRKTAYKKLIPSWAELCTMKGSSRLRKSLWDWAERVNLTEDWCMDFALDVLNAYRMHYVWDYKFQIDAERPVHYQVSQYLMETWARQAWYDALSDMHHEKYAELFIALKNVPNQGPFRFVWREPDLSQSETFVIEDHYGPLSGMGDVFKAKMTELFWWRFFERYVEDRTTLAESTKHVAIEIERFLTDLNLYIKNAKKRFKKHGQPTVLKEDGDLHFRWLVEFQVCGRDYSTIARQYGKNRVSVTEAVKRTAALIGLGLREAPKKGRPPGIAEAGRLHVVRRSEK